jgi:integrase
MSKLTDRQIKNEVFALASEETILADGLGMWLRVTDTAKSFFYRYTYNGRRRKLTLGSYPEMSLKQARDERAKAAAILASGKDPGFVKRAAIEHKRQAPTVADLGKEFFERGMKNYKNKQDAYDRLKRDPIKKLGPRLAMDIEPEDLVPVFNAIVDRGSLVAANRTLALTRKMFDYAVAQRYCLSNPVTMQAKDVGGAEVSKQTALLFEQIRAVLQVLSDEQCPASLQTRLGIKLILATGKRPSEVVSIEWTEVDLDRCEWINPWHKIKDAPEGADHLVFLSQYSVTILKRLLALNPKGRYVLPTPHPKGGQERHITRHALSEAVLRLHDSGVFKQKFTPHDLRRTFATRAAELKIPPHVVEKCLDHVMSGMMAVYNLAPYFEERKEAMDLWGSKLAELDVNQ